VRTRRAEPFDIEAYGTGARIVHWLVALLVTMELCLGWALPEAPRESESRAWLLLLHRSIGLSILGLMLFRIYWRMSHRPPALPAGFPRLQAWAAHSDHMLLYVVLLVMPLSGYVNTAAAGHSVNVFNLFTIPPLLPTDERLAQFALAVHLVTQFAVYALVGLHVAAALMHGVVQRDGIFERMLPARRPG
jgi:cytochrome b561